MSNHSIAQQQELDVLQSIYPPHILHIPPQQQSPISLTLHLTPTLSSPVQLRTTHATYITHTLPPLTLFVTLPATYPTTAPKFRLEASYLTTSALHTLADQLTDLFEPDVPVIFTFAYHILSDAFESLLRSEAPDDENYIIRINKLADRSDDIRVKRPIVPETHLVAQLLSHARAQDAAQLADSMHKCAACWEVHPGSQCIMLRGCRHVGCRDCLAGFWTARIAEGRVGERDLVCMEAECGRTVEPDEVLQVVDEEVSQRMQGMLLSRALERDAEYTECPRELCRMAAFVDDGLGRCAYCSFAFCADCRKGWHAGPCEVVEDVRQVEDVMDDWKKRGDCAIEEARENVSERIMQQVETAVLLCKMAGKKCPTCGMLVTKNGGCAHMRCVCGTEFCWNCGKELAGYLTHYRFEGCQLYEDREMQETQEAIWEWLFNE